MRWIGIDHGTKRIGLAISDPQGQLASPLDVLPAQPLELVFQDIARFAAEYEATGAVVGWPLNMDDTEGPQAVLARRFAGQLAAATGLDVRLWDERLTSLAADARLAGHYTRKQRKARQDAVAAAEILQDFLAVDAGQSAPRPRDIRPK